MTLRELSACARQSRLPLGVRPSAPRWCPIGSPLGLGTWRSVAGFESMRPAHTDKPKGGQLMHDVATPSDEWDQQPLGRLYERCPLRGRQILECLYRHPGEWVTDIVLDTNVGVSDPPVASEHREPSAALSMRVRSRVAVRARAKRRPALPHVTTHCGNAQSIRLTRTPRHRLKRQASWPALGAPVNNRKGCAVALAFLQCGDGWSVRQ